MTDALKKDHAAKHLEVVDGHGRARQQHYEPKTDEERTLDRRVNLKLDLTVVLVLALGFIVGIFKSSSTCTHCLPRARPLIRSNWTGSSAASTRPISALLLRAVSSKMRTCRKATSATPFRWYVLLQAPTPPPRRASIRKNGIHD